MLMKKSKQDLVEQYLQLLADATDVRNTGDNIDAAADTADTTAATEKILASLNSLADSDTGNPISIDSKLEILDGMKKRAEGTECVEGKLLMAIDALKHKVEHDFQEQYERYYG